MILTIETQGRGLNFQTLKRKDKDHQNLQPPMSTWEIVKSPGVPVVLSLYGHVMLLGLAYTASKLPLHLRLLMDH
jgi:hypothetical protein